MSRDERDELIRELSRAGLPVREIADELTRRGCPVSKSTVHRVLLSVPPDDDDELDRDELDLLDDPDALALFDTAAETSPVEPLTFVGYERQCFERGRGAGSFVADCERWVDGEGRSVGSDTESAEMALYRYANHVRYELDDRQRTDALAADWQRQRDEYAARFGERA